MKITYNTTPDKIIPDINKSKGIMGNMPEASFSTSVPLSHVTFKRDLHENINNREINKRPLKRDESISFKGRFSNVKGALDFLDKNLGSQVRESFKNGIDVADKNHLGLKKLAGDAIEIDDPKFLTRFKNLMVYFVKKMPLDIINSGIGVLRKIPGVKKLKFIDSLENIAILKNRKLEAETETKVAAVEGFMSSFTEHQKTLKDLKDKLLKETKKENIETINKKIAEEEEKFKASIVKDAGNSFDPGKGNYNSNTERALTRLVTGSIPAFFLANDAYNLAIYMKDNKKDAKEAKRKRFNQEAIRIGMTAVSTFGLLTLFSKASNKSAWVSTALINVVTFFSEILGRKMAGNPVLPLTKAQAKKKSEENTKKNKIKNDKSLNLQNSEKSLTKREKNASGFLTLTNAIKALGGLVAFGFLADKAQKVEFVKNFTKSFNTKYKGLFTKEATMKKAEFEKLLSELEKNDEYKGLADNYRKLVKSDKLKDEDIIKLETVTQKAKYVLIHQIGTFPVRFMWSMLMTPYNYTLKPLLKYIKPDIKPSKKVSGIENMRNVLTFIKENKDKSDFRANLNKMLVNSFNKVSKSDQSNADLGSLVKNTTSTVTSLFLIADNYNMVMMDSNGENTDLAEQKAKERTIQRFVRILYGAFIIKLCNNIFSKAYNGSLLGAELVNVGQTGVIECLERKSVGMPIQESTKDQIVESDNKNMTSTGIRGSYFRAMSFLTGKKPLNINKQQNS